MEEAAREDVEEDGERWSWLSSEERRGHMSL